MSTQHNWPDIQLPLNCEEKLEDPSIRTEFETGIVHTRARFSRMRGSWVLSWANMRGEHYSILEDFFKQMRGGSLSFNWTHPRKNITYEVRFKGNWSGRYTVKNCYSISVTLEQV